MDSTKNTVYIQSEYQFEDETKIIIPDMFVRFFPFILSLVEHIERQKKPSELKTQAKMVSRLCGNVKDNINIYVIMEHLAA